MLVSSSKLLFLGVLLGCSNPRTDPNAEKVDPSQPLTFEWTGNDFKTDSGRGGSYVDATRYQVDLDRFPKGTKYEIGAEKGATGSATASIRVEMREKLGTLTLEELDRFDPGLTLKLTLPSGRQGETKLPPLPFKVGLHDMFAKIETTGPVLFGAEAADPEKADAVIWVYDITEVTIIGRRGKLSEVDFVAVHEPLPEKGTKTCSGYTDTAGKSVAPIELVLRDTEVRIYDRRTGKIVEKKIFPTDGTCPGAAFVAGANRQDTSAPLGTIETYLNTVLKT